MTYKIKTLLLALFYCLLISCNQKTEEIINLTSKILPNQKHLVVEKTNRKTKFLGIFSNHNYGTSYRFSYKLSLNPGDINWNGGSGEPKYLLFCKDTTYIRYLKKKSIKTAYTDPENDSIKYNYHYEIQEVFQKHIDKRYFFQLFGDDYWVDMPAENYTSLNTLCNEYSVPNDNELLLKPNMTIRY